MSTSRMSGNVKIIITETVIVKPNRKARYGHCVACKAHGEETAIKENAKFCTQCGKKVINVVFYH